MAADYHTPVLLRAVCSALTPVALHPPAHRAEGSILVDATCGGGGHALALLQQGAPAMLVVLDRDREALAHARPYLEAARSPEQTIHYCHAPFSELPTELDLLGIGAVEGILVDLGVSSHQLDCATRGFSFRHDGPVDMRMDQSRGESAAVLLDRISVSNLTQILRDFGEEPDAARIARAIVAERATDNPTRTTAELAAVVANAMSGRQRRALGARVHPATRTFQALRIAVNREFDELDSLLGAAPERLTPGGRLAVISFHSLEDRRVKRRFRTLSRAAEVPRHLPVPASDLPQAPFAIPRGLTRGVEASDAERKENPRSRSARLRVLERRIP